MRLFRSILPILFFGLSFVVSKGQGFVEPKYDTLMFDKGLLTLAVFDENGVMRTKIIKNMNYASRPKCYYYDAQGRVILSHENMLSTYSYSDSLIVCEDYGTESCSGSIECDLYKMEYVTKQYVRNGKIYKEQRFGSFHGTKKHDKLQLREETDYYENGVIKQRTGGMNPAKSKILSDGTIVVEEYGHGHDTAFFYYDADGYETHFQIGEFEKIMTYNDDKTEKTIRYIHHNDSTDRRYFTYKYDGKGQLIEEEWGDYNGSNLNAHTKVFYAYNNNNQLLCSYSDWLDYKNEYNKYGGVSRWYKIHKKDTIEYTIYDMDKKIHWYEGQTYIGYIDSVGRWLSDKFGIVSYKKYQIQSRCDMQYWLSKLKHVSDYDVDAAQENYRGTFQYQETDTGYIKIEPWIEGSKKIYYYDKNFYLTKYVNTFENRSYIYEYDKEWNLLREHRINLSNPEKIPFIANYRFTDEIQDVERNDTIVHNKKMFINGYDKTNRHIQTLVYEYNSSLYEPWYKSYCVDFYYDKKNRVERRVLSVESYSNYANRGQDTIYMSVETPFLKNIKEETYTKIQRRKLYRKKRTEALFSSFGEYKLE